jgi:hypothetical protein
LAPAVGTAGGAGVDSSPNTELSERLSWAGRVGAAVADASAAMRSGAAGAGAEVAGTGRAPKTPRRKACIDWPWVCCTEYAGLGSAAGVAAAGAARLSSSATLARNRSLPVRAYRCR